MPEYTALLGRLLSDEKLRADFVADRRTFGSGYPELQELLLAIDPVALERQAQGLLTKRLHEVAFLMPNTAAKQGGRFAPLFLEYANAHWPSSHRRHMEDAVNFGNWLKRHSHALDRSELAQCELHLGKRNLHLGVTRQGLRASLECTYRLRGRIETISLSLGL